MGNSRVHYFKSGYVIQLIAFRWDTACIRTSPDPSLSWGSWSGVQDYTASDTRAGWGLGTRLGLVYELCFLILFKTCWSLKFCLYIKLSKVLQDASICCSDAEVFSSTQTTTLVSTNSIPFHMEPPSCILVAVFMSSKGVGLAHCSDSRHYQTMHLPFCVVRALHVFIQL